MGIHDEWKKITPCVIKVNDTWVNAECLQVEDTYHVRYINSTPMGRRYEILDVNSERIKIVPVNK